MTTVYFGAAAILPAFLLTFLLMPLVLKISHHKNWYSETDHRTIHNGDIPRLGGVAMFGSVMLMWALFIILRAAVSETFQIIDLWRYLPIIAGMVIIHGVGLLDDFTNLRARWKLAGQIAAALVIILSGYYIRSVHIPFAGINLELGAIGGQVLTLLWIVGITNAVNLIDGMDGLSSGISAIAALTLGISAWAVGSYSVGFMAFFLFGAIMGFLVFNFPPARIFMGDSGSLFLGFTLSIIPILAFRGGNAPFALPIGSTLMLIPIFDTLAAIMRRLRKRVPIHTPDKEHLHHKLLFFGLSTRRILLIIYALSALSGVAVLCWTYLGKGQAASLPTAIIFTLTWIIIIGSFAMLDRLYKRRMGHLYYRPE
jgi:UDP-GlcNAc:undecaprenyl-phosphate GlcNAc-1-phosphate transferase